MNREVLHIGVSENGGTRVLRLTGELDSYTSDRLTGISKTWIPGARKVIVNLDKLEHIDSSGLSALVGMWVKARDARARMVVSCQNPRIHRILEITGLLNLFNVDGAEPDPDVAADTGYSQMALGSRDALSDRRIARTRSDRMRW